MPKEVWVIYDIKQHVYLNLTLKENSNQSFTQIKDDMLY